MNVELTLVSLLQERDAFLRSMVNKGVDIFMVLNRNQESFLIPSKRRKSSVHGVLCHGVFIILNTEKLGPTNRQGLVLDSGATLV